METQWLFEEKHALLKNEINENLQRKLALELEINREFERLRKLEIIMEKTSTHLARKE